MRQTRVLLADDHTLIRAGLRLVVEQRPEFAVVGEAADGRQAVALAQSLKPDVVVMDIGMPGLNGIEACLQIRGAFRIPRWSCSACNPMKDTCCAR